MTQKKLNGCFWDIFCLYVFRTLTPKPTHTMKVQQISAMLLLMLLLMPWLQAQSRTGATLTAEEYISQFQDAAVENMYLKNIPASITLGQGMLESGNGNSELARRGNNHFGIKCHEWTGRKVYRNDNRRNECFRAYPSVLDSYKDHADFLSGRERYQQLFALDITDYKGWAKGLERAGYATDSRYAEKLIALIERHQLHRFDRAPRPTGDVFAGRVNQPAIQPGAVSEVNRVPVTYVLPGESKWEVAQRTGLKFKKLDRYNEFGPDDEPQTGDVIFLKKKRARAFRGNEVHTVKEGETIWQITQLYGVRTKSLLKRNNRGLAYTPQPGERLTLRKYKPLNPPYQRIIRF